MAGGPLEVEFSAFYRQYYSLILTIAEHRLSSFAIAEDVTSEVFRVAWERRSAGYELSLPWLYGVTRNVVGNEYRRRLRVRNLDERVREHERTVERATDDDMALDIQRGMDLLREKDREILQLVYWDDLTGEEVAAVLGITASAGRVRLLRARDALRRILARTEVRNSGRA